MQVVKREENSGEGNTINTLKPPTHPNSFRSLSMVTEGAWGGLHYLALATPIIPWLYYIIYLLMHETERNEISIGPYIEIIIHTLRFKLNMIKKERKEKKATCHSEIN